MATLSTRESAEEKEPVAGGIAPRGSSRAPRRLLPVLLFADRSIRQSDMAAGMTAFQMFATLAIDKQTGKRLYEKTLGQDGTIFHTLRIDERAGSIELIGDREKVRLADTGAR